MRLPTLGARRDHAERYLFLVIAGFAVSVAATRWFLALTGYPKVGGGGLHIAHMLWGGLLLVVAATLPLVFVGRRVLMVSAVAGGVGVGLFIDEIGKFITESNDYFFAPAAPLIYGALLLLSAVWLVVARGRSASVHDDLQAGVEAMREAADGQLTPAGRDRALARLERAGADADPDRAALAEAQATLLASPAVDRLLASPGWAERGGPAALLDRWLPLRLERALILLGLVGTALLAIITAIALVLLLAGEELSMPQPTGPVKLPQEPIWAVLLFVVATGVGVASGIAFMLMLRGRLRVGLRVGIWATMVNLVAGGLLTFYVAQFGAMASAIGHLLLLGLLLDHERRTGNPSPPPAEPGSEPGLAP
jgi:hypothetical protein